MRSNFLFHLGLLFQECKIEYDSLNTHVCIYSVYIGVYENTPAYSPQELMPSVRHTFYRQDILKKALEYRHLHITVQTHIQKLVPLK